MLNKLMYILATMISGVIIMISVVSGLCLYIAGDHVTGTIVIFAAVYGPVGVYLVLKMYDKKHGKHFVKWSQQ